ncbi:MAG: helix-turn-helix transcriptional regulator [Candidatus Paracaedibacteraceae bacterium]|nr:helix-turn-helix transcriptional regulator [Candidatus Paracaedibacteraceae bacterium]
MNMGFKDFGYWRIFDDGSYLAWANDDQFMATYFDKVRVQGSFFLKRLHEIPDDKLCFILDDYILKSVPEADLIVNLVFEYGIWNTMVMMVPSAHGYVDCYDFILPPDKQNTSEFFLTHLSYLEKYRDYFQSNVTKISGFDQFDNRGKFHDEFNLKRNIAENHPVLKMEQFLSRIMLEKELQLINGGRDVLLTLREQECLSLLLEHKSAKEIAKDMGVSYRTVETYLHNMRRKAGVTTKSGLIQMVKSH